MMLEMGGAVSDPPFEYAYGGPGVVCCLVYSGWALRLWRTQYVFHSDRLVLKGLFTTEEVQYADLAFVTRQEKRGDTARFELVREGAPNRGLCCVRIPDQVERLLADRVPAPDAWLDARDTPKHTALRAIVRKRLEAPGGAPVIDNERFKTWTNLDLADVTLADYDRLRYVHDVTDIQKRRFPAPEVP